MRIQIVKYDPTRNHVELEQIVAGMRQIDRREGEVIGADDPLHCRWLADRSQHAYVVFSNLEPVFTFGALELLPGVVQLWGFGTDKAKRVIPHMTKFILNEFGPALFQKHGVRRVQVFIPSWHTESLTWLTERLGMVNESTMKRYANDGSDMHVLAYTDEEFKQYVSSTEASSSSASSSASSGEDGYENPKASGE